MTEDKSKSVYAMPACLTNTPGINDPTDNEIFNEIIRFFVNLVHLGVAAGRKAIVRNLFDSLNPCSGSYRSICVAGEHVSARGPV